MKKLARSSILHLKIKIPGFLGFLNKLYDCMYHFFKAEAQAVAWNDELFFLFFGVKDQNRKCRCQP